MSRFLGNEKASFFWNEMKRLFQEDTGFEMISNWHGSPDFLVATTSYYITMVSLEQNYPRREFFGAFGVDLRSCFRSINNFMEKYVKRPSPAFTGSEAVYLS